MGEEHGAGTSLGVRTRNARLFPVVQHRFGDIRGFAHRAAKTGLTREAIDSAGTGA